MSFKKIQYDVEEKGLDPRKPHKQLGEDGRLLKPKKVEPKKPAAEVSEDKKVSKEKPTQGPLEVVAAKERKKKTAMTPATDKNVSSEDELKDELSEAAKELSVNKPASQKTTKTKTRTKAKKAKTSSASKAKTKKTTKS